MGGIWGGGWTGGLVGGILGPYHTLGCNSVSDGGYGVVEKLCIVSKKHLQVGRSVRKCQNIFLLGQKCWGLW